MNFKREIGSFHIEQFILLNILILFLESDSLYLNFSDIQSTKENDSE